MSERHDSGWTHVGQGIGCLLVAVAIVFLFSAPVWVPMLLGALFKGAG